MTEQAEQPQVLVRMDKSRDHAFVMGERVPGNSHQTTHYYQNGLPFDSQGILIHDHPDFEPEAEKPSKRAQDLRAKATKLAQRAIKQATPRQEGEEPDPDAEPEEKGPVNLEQWARGEARVPWQEVSQAIARRFSKRVANKADAVELLLKERVVSMAQLSDEHRKLVDGD